MTAVLSQFWFAFQELMSGLRGSKGWEGERKGEREWEGIPVGVYGTSVHFFSLVSP